VRLAETCFASVVQSRRRFVHSIVVVVVVTVAATAAIVAVDLMLMIATMLVSFLPFLRRSSSDPCH
jgi:hypothetical protein